MLSSLEKTAKPANGGAVSSGGDVYSSMVVGALADAISAAGGIGLADMIAKTAAPPAAAPAVPLPSAASNSAPGPNASGQVLGASQASASSLDTRSPSPEPLARDAPTTEPILAR